MLILASDADKLQVVTADATTTMDAHATWVDISSNTVTPGRTNTAITGAATTNVVGSPTNNTTYRTVKALTVRNTHASLPQTVTVSHLGGGTTVTMFKSVVATGEALHYFEGKGFYLTDNLGREKLVEYNTAGVPVASSFTTVVLGADVTNNSSNTLADVTGMSFSVTSGKMYWYCFNAVYTVNATSTGTRWTLNGPAMSYLNYQVRYSLTSTTETFKPLFQALEIAEATNATSAASGNNWCRLEGICQPSANGTLILRNAAELASASLITKIGSFIHYQQVN